MPRGPRSVRNSTYKPRGGGSGGGFGEVIAGLMGAPTIQGGDVTNQIDPEIDLGTSGAPVMEPYTVSKPGIFQNLLTRGRAGQQASDLNNALKFNEMQNFQAADLTKQRNQGALEVERLRSVNDITERERAAALKAEEDRALEQAALNKMAVEKGFPSWNHYKQVLENPDVMTSSLKNIYSENEKQGIINRDTESKTRLALEGDLPYKQAQTQEILKGLPTKGLIDLGPDKAVVDPTTGRTFFNPSPMREAPEVKGGPVEINKLPSYSGGSFAKTPGGVNAEFGSNSSPVPFQSPVVKSLPPTSNNSPGFLSNLVNRITSRGLPSAPTPQFTPSMGQQDSFQEFEGTKPLMEQSGIEKPVFNKSQFMEDFGGMINPILQVPLIQDYLRKRGMFAR